MADMEFHHFLHEEHTEEFPADPTTTSADKSTESNITAKCKNVENTALPMMEPKLEIESSEIEEIAKILAIQALLNQFLNPQVRADFNKGSFGVEINSDLLSVLDILHANLFPRWCGGGLANYLPAGMSAAEHLKQLIEHSENPCVLNSKANDAITYKEWFSTLESIACSEYWERVPPEDCSSDNFPNTETYQQKKTLKMRTCTRKLRPKKKFTIKKNIKSKRKYKDFFSSTDNSSSDECINDTLGFDEPTDINMKTSSHQNKKSSESTSNRCKDPKLEPLSSDSDDNAGQLPNTDDGQPITFSCKECSKVYTKKRSLIRHISSVHGENFECTECNKFFTTKQVLKIHINSVHRKEKNFKCSECGKAFSRKDHLAVHIASVHRQEKKFMCDECSTVFSLKANLIKHIESIHRKQTFNCEECAKTFSSKYSVVLHFSSVHKNEKNYMCEECSKAFTQKCTLDHHIKSVHRKERPFKCEVCCKGFALKNKLKRHIRAIHELYDRGNTE